MTTAERDLIFTFLGHLGIQAEEIEIIDGDVIEINLTPPAEAAGIFIGRYASVLDGLQLLISAMLNNRQEIHRHVLVDVGGYRARRLEKIKELVQAASTEVLSSNSPRTLSASLSPTERRQVHLMLALDDKLTTYSTGIGLDRRLVIAPKA